MEERKHKKKCIVSCLLCVAIGLGLCGCGAKDLSEQLEAQTKKTAEYVLEQTKVPRVGTVGGDWAVKGIVESNVETPKDYVELYYDNVRAAVKSSAGELHEEYYSDYARVVIGLSAIGKDAKNVEGYDLTVPLDAYEEITGQGMNAVAYTLTAIQVSDSEVEHEKAYVQELVEEMERVLPDAQKQDIDYIAMGMLGLSFYAEQTQVDVVLEEGIRILSTLQQNDGGMGNCESTAEAIVALTQLDVDVFSDERFVKNGNSLGQSLLLFAEKDGSFRHTEDGKAANPMATEKALLALDAMYQQRCGEKLYEGD